MEAIKAFLLAVAGVFGFLNKRSDLSNAPEIQKNKSSQREQDEKDEIERLTEIAESDPDPKKQAEAARKLREMDSE